MDLFNLKPIDNRDDRREIFYLLQKLTANERIWFLEWCRDKANASTRMAHNPPWVFVVISSTTGHVAETYWDLMAMIVQFGLNLDVVLSGLERAVKKARRVQVFSS